MDRLEAKLFQQAPSKQPNNKPPSQNDKNTTSKKSANNPAPVPTAKLDMNLTSQLMKELALILGPEAKNCYFNLKEISPLKNSQVLQTFRDVYAKFETLPVLFLSLVQNHKEQIVYLWQINRKCPYQKGTEFMVLDSKSQKLDVMPHPSLLVLAKIKPFKGEEIIETKLLGDYQLMVKSRGYNEGPHYIFRLYNIKDFYGTSKVNPYREEIIAGDIYSHEFQVKRLPFENLLEVSLYKRKTIEELGIQQQQQQKIPPSDSQQQQEETPLNKTQTIERNTLILQQQCAYSSQQWPRDNLFSDLFAVGENQAFYLIDKETCSIIKFYNNTFALATFPEARNVSKILQSGHILTFISNDKVYELPGVSLQLTPTGAELVTYPILLESITSQPKNFYDFFTYNNEPHIVMLNNTIFRSIPLNEPCDRPADLFNIRDPLKTSKSLSWTSHMMGPSVESAHPLLFFVCNNFLHIRDIAQGLDLSSIYTREKIIALPSEVSSEWANNKAGANKDQKGVKEQRQSWDWEIIGFSSRKLYLARKFVNQQSVQLVEMSLYAEVEGLFREDFEPEFKYIRKEDYYLMPFDLEMFAQFDRTQEIVFISFENEPFYHDEVNLMYNVQLSLKNPQETENQKAEEKKAEESNKKEDKENKEKNFYKKIEKTKVEISHKKDINKGLEETKEALKNIRGDISSKMGEVQEFNKKYLDQEKNAKKDKDKEKTKLTDPGKVNKEGVQLYQELKTEKKKMNKQRDKEKGMRKKGDDRHNY